MERSNFRFTLDIRDSGGGCQLDMKRGDTHRRLCIALSDGGCPYVITEGCYPVLMAKTEDGRLLYTNCAVKNGEVICDLTSAYTATLGQTRCELRLYDTPIEEGGTEGQLLTTCTFVIRIHPTVYNEEEELQVAGSVEATALTQLVQEARSAAQAAENTAQALLEQRDEGAFDGVSATHRWDGTTLVITSGSGTSSAQLKGEKGDRGEKGDPGTMGINDDVVEDYAWSARHLVDTFCPAICQSGNVVSCTPIAHYPMGVAAEKPATVTVCGKNLFDPNTKLTLGYVYIGTGTLTQSANYYYTDPIPAAHLVGQVITLNKVPSGVNPGMCFYNAQNRHLASGKGTAMTVPQGTAYLRFSLNKADIADNIQLELGSTATEYAPYRAESFSVITSRSYLSRYGVNTYFAYAEGESVPLTITGRGDPAAEMEKLQNQINQLTRRLEDV